MSYTKPLMRERLKNKIMAGSEGGKPGQWSARKAQLLAQRYEKAGGGRKIDAWTGQHRTVHVDFNAPGDDPRAFFNANTLDELRQLESPTRS